MSNCRYKSGGNNHNSDVVSMDFLYVQGIPFHHSITTDYKYRTADAVRGKRKKNGKVRKLNARYVRNLSKRAINKYLRRGVSITQINADNEFNVLGGEVGQIALNIVGMGEHVGDVERSIRTVKEQIRCHEHRLPYTRYPTEMVYRAMRKAIMDLNMMIPYDGISQDLPPGCLIDGKPPPTYEELMELNFGDYFQAHVPADTTNDNEARTVEAIALYPSGNAQES